MTSYSCNKRSFPTYSSFSHHADANRPNRGLIIIKYNIYIANTKTRHFRDRCLIKEDMKIQKKPHRHLTKPDTIASSFKGGRFDMVCVGPYIGLDVYGLPHPVSERTVSMENNRLIMLEPIC